MPHHIGLEGPLLEDRFRKADPHLSAWMWRWLRVGGPACREQVPWQQRAANMAALVTGVGECMATRFTVFGENLWRVAVVAFNAIVAIGLPAVNIACVNDDQPPEPKVWTALAQAFER